MIRALKEFDTDRLRLYPEPTCKVLVDAIAEYYGLKSSQVFVGVGSDDVLAMSFLTFFNSDKPILFPDITYSFYDVWAELFRIPYERPALDENFRLVKEDYYRENGGVVFPNPNAPTGIYENLANVEDIISHNGDSIVLKIKIHGRFAYRICNKQSDSHKGFERCEVFIQFIYNEQTIHNHGDRVCEG